MRYEVMKHGHKIGHRRLDYGSVVTPTDLGVKDADLQPFVQRGVLRATRKQADSSASLRRSGKSGARRSSE